MRHVKQAIKVLKCVDTKSNIYNDDTGYDYAAINTVVKEFEGFDKLDAVSQYFYKSLKLNAIHKYNIYIHFL